jgi:hypothetical protein
MDHHRKRRSRFVLRLIAGLVLLGCARVGVAQGTWSVISAPGQVIGPTAICVDGADNLYVVDNAVAAGRIQMRDAQGIWSLIATYSGTVGQVIDPTALAVDGKGNLYVADGYEGRRRIQKRDVSGNWSVVAPVGRDLGQVSYPTALAVGPAGNLYVGESNPFNGESRVQLRSTQGNWLVIATGGTAPGQVNNLRALAVDAANNLYVADVTEDYSSRVQKQDAQGNWSVIVLTGPSYNPVALAVDYTGNLFLAGGREIDIPNYIWKQDIQGIGMILATDEYPPRPALRQTISSSGLAVDDAGNLYVADGVNRVLKYAPGP